MPDSNQIIGATLQVDASSAADASKSVATLKSNIKDLQAQFEATKSGSVAQVDAYKKLKAAQDELAQSTKNVAAAAEGGSGSFSKIREQVSGLGGPLGEASEGVGKLGSSFEALLANPVVLIIAAIVAALALLYKAFTNSFEGGEKMEQVFAGIKAAAQSLLDNIGHIASAIGKLFTFDFSGAAAEIKAVANAAAEAYGKMADLTKQAQELHREQLTNDLDQANRQKQLAVLRSQSQDEDVPVAKRKAALKELLASSEDEATKEIALAKKITDNKIAQLTLEKEGDKKNQDDINKLKIDQITKETEAANEIRQIRRSLTQATKQELAEEKEARDKAAAEAKARRQELVDFINRLDKIQEENKLDGIKDTYLKEQQQIQLQIDDQKRQTQVDLQSKKITADQASQLDAALEVQRQVKLDALRDKHSKEIEDKEAAFQKDLQGVINKTRADGQTNARDKERADLLTNYQQQLADAAKNYKDNADHLQQIKLALAAEYHAENQALEDKFRKEDAKKALDRKVQTDKAIITDNKNSLATKQAALDDERAAVEAAYKNGTLDAEQYTKDVKDLDNEQIQIDNQVAENKKKTLDIISQALGVAADLLGKSTAAGKAAAIAEATLQTYSAAWSIFAAAAKNPLTIPFPAYPYIQAGLAIVAGIENVKKILSVNTPGGSGAASAPSAAGSAAPPAAPIAPVQVSTTFTPQQNPTTGAADSNRAYVLDADIQNAAERNARLQRASRLGGK